MKYDIVLSGGLIVDGTGAPARKGAVAINDGRVAAIGDVDGDAKRTIDVGGQVIAPGFIDAHTHYDAQLLWDPSANPSTAHGITTVLLGNCGYTLAPVRPDDQDYLMGLFAAAEELPKRALETYAPFDWETFADYVGWLGGRVGVNVVTQIGHSAVRRYVMGEAALERPATVEEIAEMVSVVEAAMDAGAAGISTSQAPHQLGENGEHIPSFFADDAERGALAEAIRRKGKRLLSINPATKRDGLSEEDRAQLVELAEISGAVVSWNDFGMGTPHGESVLEFMEGELERGHEIYAVARCQRPETRFTLKKLSVLFATFEPWLEYGRLDGPAKLAALRDPGWRARLGEFWDGAKFMVNTSVEKGVSPTTAPLEGRMLIDIAAERGTSPAEVMFDVALADELETFFRIAGKVDVDESHLERILKSPATVVGISDGGAHLQTFAGGDYTSYFLQHWVHEKHSFTLEEGVAALSSRVADFLGLDDRGTLEVGKAADVVVFDPETVGPLALETLDDIPGGGTRMTKNARGISWVIVNGEPVIEDGAAVDVTPGQVLGEQWFAMTRVLPVLRDWNHFYWTSGADGQLRFRSCSACGALQHPPAPVCRACGSDELEVRAVSGQGVVQSHTTNLQQWSAAYPTPFVVAVVAIDEDPRVRLTTNIVGCEHDAVHVGMRVQVVFEQTEDVWIPVFEPTGEPSAELASEDEELERIRSVRPMPRLDKFEDHVTVTGIGMSRVGRKLMIDPVTLGVEAIRAAVDDAGLTLADIDGLSTYPGTNAAGGYSEGGVTAVESALGIRPTWHNGGQETPGATGSLIAAMIAVAAGLCRHVVCFRTVWQSTAGELARRSVAPEGTPQRVSGAEEYLAPYGVQAANTVAMAATQHFARYGTTRETLGWIAINARANAMLNPTALYREPLTMDDYLAARPISTPFGLFDCDALCDGSVAVVVSAADAAVDLDRPPVRIEAVGMQITERMEWDQGVLSHEPQVLGPAAHLWSRTTMRPTDVDVAELYDGFTFNCLSWIEALGFCEIGEAKHFLDGGKNIARDGQLPVNTHGGQLSHGRTHGMGLVHEAITQLRGDAGPRQVCDATTAVVTSGGLTPGGAILFRADR